MKKLIFYGSKSNLLIKNENFVFDDIDKKINEILKTMGFKYSYNFKEWSGQPELKNKIIDELNINKIEFLIEEKLIEDKYITKEFNTEFIKNKMIEYSNKVQEYEVVNYQIAGVNFLLNRKFAFLGDMLGLGKTIETVVALRILFEIYHYNKIIVITQKTILADWSNAINMFSFNDGFKESFTFTNFEQFISKNSNELLNKKYDIVVVDEATFFRNSTKTRTEIMKIKADRFWLLSGEMIEKNPLDVYYIFNTFTDIFNFDEFEKKYVIYKTMFFGNKKIKQPYKFKNMQELKSEIEPYFLRRTREDVSDEVEKIDIISKDINVDLTTQQDTELKELRQKIMERKFISNKNKILSLFQETRLILDDANYKNGSEINSNKFAEMKKILDMNKDNKIIIFTSYKIILEKLEKELIKNGYKVITVASYMSMQERNEKIEEYKKSKELNILLASDILAYGKNLETSSVMIHYDMPLLASKIKQRTFRMIRKNSTHNRFEVYYLVTNSKFDQTVKNILLKKVAFSSALTGDKDSIEKIGLTFSKDEMNHCIKSLL